MILYVEPTSFSIFLETSISASLVYVWSNSSLLFSIVNITSAEFLDGRPLVPAKIISFISPALSLEGPASPMFHFIASTILDFPHPLGPTSPVSPGLISSTVVSTKDLKPVIFNRVNFIKKPHKTIYILYIAG